MSQILVCTEDAFVKAGAFEGFSKDASRFLNNPEWLASLHYTERGPAETNETLKQIISYWESEIFES